MSILICINLLNYMDRFTVAGKFSKSMFGFQGFTLFWVFPQLIFSGVLTNIQAFFSISDADGGLLQTAFIVFFMFCSPVCGFLGDRSVDYNNPYYLLYSTSYTVSRYNRKWIMIVGVTIWVAAVFASTFTSRDVCSYRVLRLCSPIQFLNMPKLEMWWGVRNDSFERNYSTLFFF